MQGTRPALLGLLVTAALLTACAPEQNDASRPAGVKKPNIILILLDDLGFNDLGANGNGAIKTPRLDQLAREGVRFTRHYTDNTCTTTRVGIMTGMPPARQGFRPDNLGLSPELVTLPEMLQSAGYSTHHIGKWHIGFASRLGWPTAQGFDTFFGFLNQFLLRGPHPTGSWSLNRPTYHNPWLQQDDQEPKQHRGHLSAILAQQAVDFISSRTPGDAPWFLNFWTFAPHNPIQPLAEFARRYPDDAAGRYRALVEQVDATVGRIMDALDDQGLADSTLVLVASDNGGTNRQIDNNAPFFGTKASFFEGGVRTPMILRWPGKLTPGTVHDGVVSYLDYFPTLARAAGAQANENAIGGDLIALINKPERPRHPLYWETTDSRQSSWSVLSADGRWRLVQNFTGAPRLFDLVTDPSGTRDVAAEQPEVVASLDADYRSWRRRQNRVETRFQAVGPRGIGKVTGASLSRVPGYAGHTFAIGLTPATTGSTDEQVIAFQEKQWKLSQQGDRLKLSLQGHELEAPAPPPGRCSALIVASHFQFAFSYPKLRGAVIEILIDGKPVAELTTSQLALPADAFLQPTYIGQAADGSNPFHGALGRPLLFNEKLMIAGSPDAAAAALQSELCPAEGLRDD